jgi:hypothetical protein
MHIAILALLSIAPIAMCRGCATTPNMEMPVTTTTVGMCRTVFDDFDANF